METSTASLSDSGIAASFGDYNRRSRSPQRARKAREKYWSYRHIHPSSQRSVPHLDFEAPCDIHKRIHCYCMSPLPADAPVVIPTKRQLFEEAQRWPRPPRRHFADRDKDFWQGSRNRQIEGRFNGIMEDFSFGFKGIPRKFCKESPHRATHPRAYGVTNSNTLIGTGASGHRRAPEILDDAVAEVQRYEASARRHSWSGPSDTEIDPTPSDGNGNHATDSPEWDVDALFVRAEQARELKRAARWKSLQRRGWDVWETGSTCTTEAEWETLDADSEELAAMDFEMM